MSVSVLYRYESVLNATSIEELCGVVEDLTEQMGFPAFHYGAHAPVRPDGRPTRFLFDGIDEPSLHMLTNYPDAWADRYREQHYLKIDPLLQHCSRSTLPILWHERRQPDTKKAARMFDEARQHGLATGVAFSIHGINREHSVFSLAIANTRPQDKRDLVRQIGSAYLLLVHLHEAVRRLAFPEDAALGHVELTARERESLLWVSSGKTSWEIAQILGISENTVTFHINNAKRKLDANSRAQAAAKALAAGLIDP
ncbi:LuxR family transcriptional regulator [Mangrovitalea sediminis]|uniref:LuxR family transcriptional regulator n=1 Tax=Mangrovitalea sediminis TaxID=1982043 RepID=UPI000BE5112E|nr:LuxR family transcriptional regulator [Mangrovitalea sediminis]